MSVLNPPPATGRRLIQLEAVRGIAALVVLADHFSLGFMPAATAPFPEGLGGTPFYWCINGTAAVMLFFLLSGFVLTRRYFDRDVAGAELATAAAKRLPRLMVPATLSILLSWALLRLGLAWHGEAARLTGSDWLATYANAQFRAGSGDPSFGYALVQGVTVFLGRHFAAVTGTDRGMLNSSLWTMTPEFVGSVLCFALVWSVRTFDRRRLVGAVVSVIVILLFILSLKALCVPFVLGVLLARSFRYERLALSRRWAALSLAVGLALCSSRSFIPDVAGALVIITATLACPPLAGAMSRRWGARLGRYSFPIYLVHAPILCSATSATYVATARAGTGPIGAIAVAALATAAATLLIATPFAMLEAWWVPALDRWATAVRERVVAGHRRIRPLRARP